jgi:hypothetical protein
MAVMTYSLWKKLLWVKMADTNDAALSGFPEKTEALRVEYRKLLEVDYPHHLQKLKQEIQANEVA